MTQTVTRRHVDGVLRPAAWIARLQRQLTDRIFADGDAFASGHGWKITKTAGRFGFGARSYSDPRFSQRAMAAYLGTEAPRRTDE
jgi:hypothetical protein